MQIGLIGLGRMGGNIARRLMRHGHEAIVYDRDSQTVAALASDGAVGVAGIDQLVHKLSRPRAVWMMPAGEITETAIAQLGTLLEAGDVILDGGNSFWKDDSGALGG
jgi:6-phosphogluconate dehydrogenase